MLKTKCFIIGMILPLSLQANGVTYCPCPPIGAIVRKQKLDKERREREQIAQLNKLLNERIEQGKTIEITTDKNVKLLIKQRKMVDATVGNENQSLTECILSAIGIIMVLCLSFFAPFIIIRPWKRWK